MNCPNCGSNLVVKGKFCPHCGTAIPEDISIKIDSRQEILDHARVAEAQEDGKAKIAKEKTKRRYGFLSINFLGDGDLRAYEGGYFLPFEALNDFNSTREPFPEPEPKPKPVRKPRTTTTAKPATKRRAKKKLATKKTPIITAPKKRGRPPKEKT